MAQKAQFLAACESLREPARSSCEASGFLQLQHVPVMEVQDDFLVSISLSPPTTDHDIDTVCFSPVINRWYFSNYRMEDGNTGREYVFNPMGILIVKATRLGEAESNRVRGILITKPRREMGTPPPPPF
jgi:hypothetical protein